MVSSTAGVSLILLFLLHQFPCALNQQEPTGFCDTPFKCGNIKVGFPFSGEDRNENCGHPSLKLNCNKRTNTTTILISGYNYSLLHIDNQSNTLRLSRQDFSGFFCSASFSSTPLPSDLFQNLPSYKTLIVFYACDPRRHFLGNFTCPVRGLGSVIQISKYRKLCDESFRVTVPKSYVPNEQALSLTRLESVLRKGFEVKLKIGKKFCQDCIMPGGHCGLICCNIGSGIGCHDPMHISGGTYSKNRSIVIITFGSAFVLIERRTKNAVRDHNLEALVTLRRYSYGDIKKITKTFTEVVGRGGFGTVYKGKLRDGRKVAVKVLNDSKGNCEDFINEVASISQTSHVNIVSLLGFCYEKLKKVVEMMEGSLESLEAPPKPLLHMPIQNIAGSSQPSCESSFYSRSI